MRLTRLRQPSFNNIKIRSTACNISSVFGSGKSISQCDFLCQHLGLKVAGSNKPIIVGIPYLNKTTNIMSRNLGLKSINSPENCFPIGPSDINALFFELLILELIRSELVDFSIIPGAVIKTASARNGLWPLFASDWIEELPLKVRKLILLHEGSPRLKRFFKELHVHLEQSVYCIACRPVWEAPIPKVLGNNDLTILNSN